MAWKLDFTDLDEELYLDSENLGEDIWDFLKGLLAVFVLGSAYLTYRMIRAPIVLAISLVAMVLAFNPLTLIIAAGIWESRKWHSREMWVPANGETKKLEDMQDNPFAQKPKYKWQWPWVRNNHAHIDNSFLPPILTNRIIGYDQGFWSIVAGHLKELFWLALAASVPVTAFEILPFVGGVFGLGALATFGVLVGIGFGAVLNGGFWGHMLRPTFDGLFPPKNEAGKNKKNTLAYHPAGVAVRIKNNFIRTLWSDYVYLRPPQEVIPNPGYYVYSGGPNDELSLYGQVKATFSDKLKSAFTGGSRVHEDVAEKVEQAWKNRI